LDMLGSGSVRRQTLGIRYNLNLSSDDVVWLPLVEWSVSLCYPNAADDERQVLVSAFCHAYASSTTAQDVSSFGPLQSFVALMTLSCPARLRLRRPCICFWRPRRCQGLLMRAR